MEDAKGGQQQESYLTRQSEIGKAKRGFARDGDDALTARKFP